MAIHYSKHFNVAHKQFERLGVYDGYLDRVSSSMFSFLITF